MSAILSADDLNDFISPGVACIKPIETLPKHPDGNEDAYEVTTEDKIKTQNPPSQISLTDCLACSGCVTSAEAVLVSLQSHAEVLNTLDSYPEIRVHGQENGFRDVPDDGKIFVASVSPQVRASIAATFDISERRAGYMIEQFLSGPHGLRTGGRHGSGFTWVLDTNIMRQVVLELGTEEVSESLGMSAPASQEPNKFPTPNRPILSSSCPGWICYVEKTHPHVLPHLSRLKSPQALTGTLLKTTLSKFYNVSPSRIWHLAIMPCFDKKLEASRQELTDVSWKSDTRGQETPQNTETLAIRDVDCVITSRELLMLASSRNMSLTSLPLQPLSPNFSPPFPDKRIARFLSSYHRRDVRQSPASGPSGGHLHHLLTTYQSCNTGSIIESQRGRNVDVVEYTLVSNTGQPIIKAARYYGFRNIQNLVRKLKPARGARLRGSKPMNIASKNSLLSSYQGNSNSRSNQNGTLSTTGTPPPTEFAYVEVMACPGGCTNGGGQIRVEDINEVKDPSGGSNFMLEQNSQSQKSTPHNQRAWLSRVDEAYYSEGSETSDTDEQHNEYFASHNRSALHGNGSGIDDIHSILKYWSDMTNVPLANLVYTTFRKVESDVGKSKNSVRGVGDTAGVAELAGKAGGGW